MGRVLLVHLSDIHIQSQYDPVLRRATQIVNAVRGLDYSLAAAMVLVSGDLAYSGKLAEYESAWKFLLEVQSLLHASLNEDATIATKPVGLFAIPGNHDCDFSEPDDLRVLAVEGVLVDPAKAQSPSIVEACLKVQESFFTSLKERGTEGIGISSSSYDRRISYEYNFPVDDQAIRLMCLNSAWISMRNENQGRILLHADVVADETDTGGITIAMFHHPYRWMRADEARDFQKRIEAVADLILTGHEHEATRRVQTMSTGEHNEYVEGGVLQDRRQDHSNFNAFVLDLHTKQQKAGAFHWDGNRYVPSEHDDNFMHQWIDLPIHRNRTLGRFAISSQMEATLSDLGATLTHRDHGLLRLSDVFVFPDLAEVPYVPDRSGRFVAGPSVPALAKNVQASFY